ncbi:MAG: Crp/Fnr family transcriptional regulator [Bacteroidota bacterium]
MQRIKVKKGEILQKKGEVNSKVFAVESGLLRSFLVDKNGKEHIFMFAPEGWIIAENNLPDRPSDLFIAAIEDSIVVRKEKLGTLEDVHKLLKRLGVLQQRILMMMSASAIERYEFFVKTYPNIVERVPQKMIASYLGVTPETLSAAKSTKAKCSE